MYNNKLLLNQARYLEAGSSDTTIPISLNGDKDIIVDDKFTEIVNQYDVYLDEREACTKIRLTVDVNLLASNIIFNSVTEIVKNEGGGSKCKCLNYKPEYIDTTFGGKNKYKNYYFWGSSISEAVMDTQISWDGDEKKNYTYLPGIDIINNHILRSKTSFASCPFPDSYTDADTQNYNQYFNTIQEYLSDEFGVSKSLSAFIHGSNSPRQRYTKSTIMTFFGSLSNNLKDDGGWIGFLNKCQMTRSNNPTGTDRVLNNRTPNEHIDLFPGRDRYSLTPHYNKEMSRYEKNWEYCLVYPSGSTSDHIPFINKELNTLKILFIDENQYDDDGVNRCVVYTVSKHGLKPDDEINLYRSTEDNQYHELVEANLVVDEVFDDYTFTVYTSEWICDKWLSVYDNEQCEVYNVQHLVANKFYVTDYYYSDDNKWRYDASADTYGEYGVEDNATDPFYTVEVSGDTYMEYSSSDYLNIDYDYYGLSGVKYFPYQRFGRWLNNQDVWFECGDDNRWSAVTTHFIEHNESFEIRSTLSDSKLWIPEESCLESAKICIDSCEKLDGDNQENRNNAIDFGPFESISAAVETSASTIVDRYLGMWIKYTNTLTHEVEYWRYVNKNSLDDGDFTDPTSWYDQYHFRKLLYERLQAYFYDTVFDYDGDGNGDDNSQYEFAPIKSPDHEPIFIDSIQNGYIITVDKNNLKDIGSQNLSFAKTVNDVQCKYYVRIFSRFPNFDFYDKQVTYENIYSPDTDSTNKKPIDYYSQLKYEQQTTMSKLGFSKNIYGDTMAEIVYNDDIDIDVIQDNLGRPLTSLYLMFFKTNYGYKEWYTKNVGGENENIPNYSATTVEWSRCFGKLNCGFECSPYIDNVGDTYDNVMSYGNIHTMNNVYNGPNQYKHSESFNCGLNEEWLYSDRPNPYSNRHDYDEIFYKYQDKFYGDLCCYSPYECLEQTIQDSYHRFNTAQRELSGRDDYTTTGFGNVMQTEVNESSINQDPGAFVTTTSYDSSPTGHPEGSFYKSNYEIPIRTFSVNVSEYNPKLLDISKIEGVDVENNVYKITTAIENNIDNHTPISIFDTVNNVSHKCEIVNVLCSNILNVKIPGFKKRVPNNPLVYKLYKINPNIPSYAELMPGNDLIYRWRDVNQNGFEDVEGLIDEYPFVNGCLYVHRNINIFLRRQDPFGEYGLSTQTPYYGLPIVMGEKNPFEDGENSNETFNEGMIRC